MRILEIKRTSVMLRQTLRGVALKMELNNHISEKQQEENGDTLTRGEIARFDETTLKRLQELLVERKRGELESMIGSAKLSANFGGNYHSIYFRANQAIKLTSLGFWGPFEKKSGDYNVKIVVSEYLTPLPSISVLDEVVLGKMETTATADAKQLFLVQLATPIQLQPEKWTRIRFQLNGPDTCVCSGVKSHYCCRNSNVVFEFFDSSHQLPVINFTIS